ncbi:MAG: glycosyltransferase family 39 protein [Deltaproteobacteria bacterium]|nr:glycosyltransferase family 39 protein [Deltaproteobacteria bacterium]
MKTWKDYSEKILVVLLLILIFCVVTLSCVPPVAKDELVHHLAIPRLYLKHGGMCEIPFMPFSYYPMNLQLLYLIPLYLGNDIVPKFIHFSFALLTAYLIFIYLRPRLDRRYALLGALFFLSIPIVVKLSITAYIDLGVIFFSFASLFFILKWIESGFRIKFLIYSAIICGLGLGTKYNALITLLLFTLFVPFAYSRYRKGRKPGFFRTATQGLVFFFVALLIFSPWMLRNYQWKKNPIYPFYDHVFNPPVQSLRDADGIRNEKPKSGIFTVREALYQEKWWEMALLPMRVFFQGEDGDPKYFDGKLSPFLLLFPFFAFFRFRRDSAHLKAEKTIFAAFAFLYFFVAFFSFGLRIRYIAPFIPPLVVLAIFGIHRIQESLINSRYLQSNRIKTSIFFMIVLSSLIYNAAYLYGQFKTVDPFSYLSGSVTRDEYIARFRPEYPAVLYINRNMPMDAAVSLIFLGNRGYYLDRAYVYGEEKLLRIGKKSETPENILVGLSASGITHLFIFEPLLQKWVGDNFPGRAGLKFQQFFAKHTKLLFHKNGFFVFALHS